MENQFVSVERIVNYSKTPPEAPLEKPGQFLKANSKTEFHESPYTCLYIVHTD